MTETAPREAVLHNVRDGVATIRLNRPEKLNAVDGALRRALAQAVRKAERDAGTRVVVVTGEGRAFCAGADVVELSGREEAVEAIRAEYETILGTLHTMPKPVLAALNGVAAGVGASIALACDLRIAVPDASLVEAFVKRGLTVDGGATWFLPRLIGTARAYELFYTGRPLGAEEAERLGVFNKVVEPDRLEAEVGELAAALAAGPAGALGAIKRSVLHAQTSTLEEAMDFEFLLQGVQMESADFKEGVAAFLEKRQPRFGGR